MGVEDITPVSQLAEVSVIVEPAKRCDLYNGVVSCAGDGMCHPLCRGVQLAEPQVEAKQ